MPQHPSPLNFLFLFDLFTFNHILFSLVELRGLSSLFSTASIFDSRFKTLDCTTKIATYIFQLFGSKNKDYQNQNDQQLPDSNTSNANCNNSLLYYDVVGTT